MNAPITIDTLAAAWVIAKASEDRVKAERYEIEKAMLGLLPVKEEGTVSSEAAGMNITASYKLTRKADTLALRQCWLELSKEAQDCFKWSADVSLTEIRRASESAQAEAAQFITTSPAKPSIKIESK